MSTEPLGTPDPAGATPRERDRVAKLIPEPIQGKSVSIPEALEQEPKLRELANENEKVADLRTRIQEMEVEKQEPEARRERLELPAIDREMLSRLVDKFKEVLAEVTNPQKKSPSPLYGEEGAHP